MKRKEVILINAGVGGKDLFKVKLSDRLKAMRNMARRARKRINNRSARDIQMAYADYYYAKRCIHHIENALRGKYNIMVVSKGALNVLKKEAINRSDKNANQPKRIHQ